MRNQDFKVSLFRFIDLLPTLKEDDLIVRMIYEYFSGLEDAPLIVRRGSRRISEHGILPHIAARSIRSAVNSLAGHESIIIGPPEDPHNTMGPLVDEAALKKVKRYIRIAKKEGKPLLVRKAKGDGYFVGAGYFYRCESRIKDRPGGDIRARGCYNES
jgi:hypothetical protein